MPELRRLLLLCALGLVLLAYGIGWQIAHPEPRIVTETRYELVVFPQTHSVAPQALPKLRGEPEPSVAVSVAARKAKRYYGTEDMIELLGQTPWPVHLWPAVFALVSCESPAEEGVDALAVGDEHLIPLTGPSLGITQTNVAAHPGIARSFDLLDPRQSLIAAYIIWTEAGKSFSPWKTCAERNGLP